MAATLYDNYTPATPSVSNTINFSTSSASFTSVTNSSVSFTNKRGRAVLLIIVPTTTAADSEIDASGTNTADSEIQFTRDSTNIGRARQLVSTAAGGDSILQLPPSAFSFIDTPGIGTFTYALQMRRVSSGTATLENCKLYCFEL